MASRRWLGRAVAAAHVVSFDVADTWAQGDTATLTINGKDLTLTVGTTTTTAQIAADLTAMVNGGAANGDELRSETGANVGEFARISAAVSASTVTLTGDDKGVPFQIAVSESTAGDGTLANLSTDVVATGPNHFDNPDNWSGDAVPADGDDVIFDSGDVDCLFGIAQSAITPSTIIVTRGYTGRIGLPEKNETEAELPYDEYRPQYLQLGNAGDATVTTIRVGDGSGSGSSRIKLDSGDGQIVLNVFQTGQREDIAVPALLWKGAHAANGVNVNRGDVGIAFFSGETAHVDSLRVGYVENQAADSAVVCGSGVDLGDAQIDITGGTLVIDSATGSGAIAMLGGELSVLRGAHAEISIDGGVSFYRSTGALASVRIGGGAALDFTRDNQSRIVTNCELHAGGTLRDPFKSVTWSNGIDVVRASLAEVSLDLGTHLTLTPSAV
ncbi:MAG: hypothetical protein RIC55_21400 [Pirellulaceae bacterium]